MKSADCPTIGGVLMHSTEISLTRKKKNFAKKIYRDSQRSVEKVQPPFCCREVETDQALPSGGKSQMAGRFLPMQHPRYLLPIQWQMPFAAKIYIEECLRPCQPPIYGVPCDVRVRRDFSLLWSCTFVVKNATRELQLLLSYIVVLVSSRACCDVVLLPSRQVNALWVREGFDFVFSNKVCPVFNTLGHPALLIHNLNCRLSVCLNRRLAAETPDNFNS